MGTISFKSVGRTADVAASETPDVTVLPIGIVTPLRQGDKGGIFDMHFDLGDQIRDNLKNLLLTNWGERLCLFDFGANLRELTTEFASRDDFDNEAVNRVRSAVNRWMPYVSLVDYVPTAENVQNVKTGIISFKITYDVPTIGLKDQTLEIVLYVI
jgi:phage baseplate assembly protein W